MKIQNKANLVVFGVVKNLKKTTGNVSQIAVNSALAYKLKKAERTVWMYNLAIQLASRANSGKYGYVKADKPFRPCRW